MWIGMLVVWRCSGANKNARNKEGQTAYDLASRNPEAQKYLKNFKSKRTFHCSGSPGELPLKVVTTTFLLEVCSGCH
jgi:hypothetical protein